MAPFGLSIGGEKTKVFEVAIQNELIRRGYTTEPDDTMSEYITIMLINNKSPDDILKECISFLGNDVERSFVDWLFEEAARNEASGEPEPTPAPLPAAAAPTAESTTAKPTSSSDKTRPPPSGPRVFQQAIGQAQASTSPTAQKRTASARSPSPTPGAGGQGPNKSRRTDAPTGPRAMRDGPRGPNSNVGGRSLLERVGPARAGPPPPPPFNPGPGPNMMNGLPPGAFPPGMNEMEMAQAMQGMNGPNQQMMFQEMMMNHMALMAQMASGMGMLPPPGMMGGPPGMGMGGPPPGMGGPGFGGPGMGPGPRNGPGRPQRGRGGRPNQGGRPTTNEHSPAPPTPSDVHVPQLAAPIPQPAPAPAQPAFAVPDRPQSPTLCKFGQKCTNAHCRWSHASPVSTAESGVVLSTEACESGRECGDKDCIRSHVSPAAVNPALAKLHRPTPAPVPVPTPSIPANGAAQCRYGMACTRRDCTFSHPPNHPLHKPVTSNVPCRFGSACTRATCTFAHPADRVLPGSFHKGLSPAGNGGAGSPGGAAATLNKSVVFNKSGNGNGGGGSELERKIKALQEEKDKAEKGIREAEAAKKEGGGGDKGVVAAAA